MVEQWAEVALGITAWYLTSFGTLLLNKHIMNTLHIQPNTLAVVQMVSTAIYGALKTLHVSDVLRGARQVCPPDGKALSGDKDKGANGIDRDLEDPTSPSFKGHVRGTWRRSLAQMGFVGAMRFATVVLGLVSLKHVAASFTETIKSTAPFFTVVIAYVMLGERTSPLAVLSLVPVAAGLVMVTYAELSFNMVGFSAAVATNVIECVQNVFSKRLLAREYSASQLQFYTSLTALILQAPLQFFGRELMGSDAGPLANATFVAVPLNGTAVSLGDVGGPYAPQMPEFTRATLAILWVDGVLYHLQSVAAYVVMSYLSPVTVSVVNTLKRAMAIWVSVLVFGNTVTPVAKLGTSICLLGALGYNVARQQLQQANPADAARPGPPAKRR